MKQLYILRHAKTSQISGTGKDFDRELLPKGHNQTEALNQYFEKNPFTMQTDIWVSSAVRTRQTFQNIKKALEKPGKVSSPVFADDLYLSSYELLLKKIWKHSSANDLLIIGHNFGISDLAGYFTEQDIELATGEFIHLIFDCDSWQETSRGTATVSGRFRPLKNKIG